MNSLSQKKKHVIFKLPISKLLFLLVFISVSRLEKKAFQELKNICLGKKFDYISKTIKKQLNRTELCCLACPLL